MAVGSLYAFYRPSWLLLQPHTPAVLRVCGNKVEGKDKEPQGTEEEEEVAGRKAECSPDSWAVGKTSKKKHEEQQT